MDATYYLFLVPPLIDVLIGIGIVAWALPFFRLRRKIMNLPTSTVRAAAMGLAEFKGNAKAITPARSMFSKAGCAYCALNVRVGEGSRHRQYAQVYEMKSGSRFYLEDDTGRILVDPKGGHFSGGIQSFVAGTYPDDLMISVVDMAKAKSFVPVPYRPLTAEERAGVDSLPPDVLEKMRSHAILIQEDRLEDGSAFYALGRVSLDGTEHVVGSFEPEKLMYIATGDEKSLLGGLFMIQTIAFFVGAVMVAGGLFFILVFLISSSLAVPHAP